MSRKISLVLIIIITFLIFFDIYLFFHGSFEQFPSIEQNEKIKIISVLVAIILIFLDIILLIKNQLKK